MIRDHMEASFTIERGDLEMAPFDGKAGWGRCTTSSGTAWMTSWPN